MVIRFEFFFVFFCSEIRQHGDDEKLTILYIL
jgi:hypothetical protein